VLLVSVIILEKNGKSFTTWVRSLWTANLDILS
jgi:hypothetical protein